MAEIGRNASATRIWTLRAVFALLICGVLLAGILPLDTVPPKWAGPDLVLALTLAWTIRRPELVPAPLVGAALLLADLILLRPPGLYAAIGVLACEMLKRRSRGLRELPFPAEWAMASVAVAMVLIGYQLALAVFFIGPLQLKLALIQAIATILAYPLTTGALRLFGLRKAARGEVDALGHRL
ncbi:rod shape-determining protein MreD [Pseudooceanicola aestuarii]|uniref:rod shape-determining protein MreD n=1 Tax=Pseudooceanicola aestuarii TaxID=2697319 RepID=UPI0013D13A69|nr:rod shape-determining protein MreD [Pseudooceanicola aestuarii]